MIDLIQKSPISLKDITFYYKDELLFDKFHLELTPGKTTCLLGPSGVGKSSLLRLLTRLSPASTEEKFSGDIQCNPNDIAYMAQDDLLLPWLTAFENALFMKAKNLLSEEAHQLFIKMGLTHCKNQLPKQLSGGMRQRVALARTLLMHKPVVLMDEPFAGLDAITRLQMQSLAAKMLEGKTLLLVTHDLFEALRLGHDIYILSGKPAKLSYHLTLSSPVPRDLADPEVIHYQAILFQALQSNL